MARWRKQHVIRNSNQSFKALNTFFNCIRSHTSIISLKPCTIFQSKISGKFHHQQGVYPCWDWSSWHPSWSLVGLSTFRILSHPSRWNRTFLVIQPLPLLRSKSPRRERCSFRIAPTTSKSVPTLIVGGTALVKTIQSS